MAKIENVIYKIKIEGSDKIYIGSTINFSRRKSRHLKDLHNNSHSNKFLQNSFNKHGGEVCFSMEVIEQVLDKNLLLKREQFHIDSFHFDLLFNLCPFANSTLGRKASPETIEKIRQNSKKLYEKQLLDGKVYLTAKGIKRSVEFCEAIKERNKNRVITQETKDKLRQNSLGRKMPENTRIAIYNANKGSKRTEESKKKISESNKGKVFSKKHKENLSKNHGRKKPVKQIDIITNETLNTFESISQASNITGFKPSSISMCCLGKNKTAKGYKWKYV